MSLYKQPGSDFWWINLSHAGVRVRRSSGTTDRTEAQRIHDEAKAELWQVTPKLKGKTWGMAVKLWTDQRERTESDLRSLIKFSRFYPDRLLMRIDADGIDQALRKFCTTPSTYTRYRNTIAAILALAAERKWMRDPPTLHVWKAKKKSRTYQWLTREQWTALRAELPPHQQAMATFAIETGLRQANVLRLRWSQVDLDRKLVWVEGVEAKGDAAISVPLSAGALNVLLEAKGQHDEFVFTYNGAPIGEIKTAFMKACVRAGVGHFDDKGHYRGFTWHGFRHTWATWHVQNGTPLEVLQKLGAWSDLRMVLVYAHHSPGFLASYANNAAKAL